MQQKNAEALLLMLWVFGTLAFSTWSRLIMARPIVRARRLASINSALVLKQATSDSWDWGFQYYMERWGAKPFDRNNPDLVRGKILVGSFSDPNLVEILGQKAVTLDETVFGAFPFLATSRLGSGASFYSSFGGPLPWIIKKIPPERYYAAHIR